MEMHLFDSQSMGLSLSLGQDTENPLRRISGPFRHVRFPKDRQDFFEASVDMAGMIMCMGVTGLWMAVAMAGLRVHVAIP